MADSTGAMGTGKRDERVIYYKKPNGWITWADSESGLAMAYITNGFRADDSNARRLAALSQAVRDACR